MEEKGLKNGQDYFEDWPVNRDKAAALRANPHWALPEEFHYTRWTGERTVAQIEQAVTAGQPLMVWASFHDPHPPYVVSEPRASLYRPQDMTPGRLAEGEHDANAMHFRKTRERDPQYWQQARHGEDGEFLDLDQDPGEVRNLWREPGTAAVKADLMHEFLQACLQSESTRLPRIAVA